MNQSEIAQAIAFLAQLQQQQLGESDNRDEDALGFCDPPTGGTAIYVDDTRGMFYEYHSERPEEERKVFIPVRGLKCQVRGLRFATKPFEGEESLKLRVDLEAHEPLMLEKSLAANFTKGLVFSLARLGEKVKEPLTIEISVPPGLISKTCFCNVHLKREKISRETKYAKDKELEEINAASDRVSEITKGRQSLTEAKKKLKKTDYEAVAKLQGQIAELQKEEEEILVKLVDKISSNL